ncbi:MAG TPA: hypothetical protein VI434_15335 [Candidatus Dormibacteraeota bacterium]
MRRPAGRPKMDKATYYGGVRMMPYDLIKELAIAMVGVLVLVLVLAVTLSSPDVPSVTIQSWAKADPVDFVTTATSELAGTSGVATYGPPYNTQNGAVQTLWFLDPQEWVGVHVPTDAANDFVLNPLKQTTLGDSELSSALTTYDAAGGGQQNTWLTNYTNALAKASVDSNGVVVTPSGDYGPVAVMMTRMLTLARSGGLDALLLSSDHFYQTDFSKALLFLGDSGYLGNLATAQNLDGSQWGMMNETGRYPGQAWLWLYTMWYQIPPFNSDTGFLGVSDANADLAVVGLMLVLSVLLVFVPFIPGLRDVPRWIPIHKLIWRRHYASMRPTPTPTPDSPHP